MEYCGIVVNKKLPNSNSMTIVQKKKRIVHQVPSEHFVIDIEQSCVQVSRPTLFFWAYPNSFFFKSEGIFGSLLQFFLNFDTKDEK